MRRYLYLVLILWLLAVPTVAQARSHRFLRLDIEAQVGADGVVRVTETHTVQFDGTFSGMFQWIDTSRGIKVANLVISEGGVPYTRLETDSPGPVGTYFVREEANRVYVDWSFVATDEVRKFQLNYDLHNVILKHNDVAEFYYKFVGDSWDQPRDYVRVTLSLPYGAKVDEVAAWGHGPRQGRVIIDSPSQIVWEVENLPANTFVEGRVVFPNTLVPLAARFSNEERLEAIFNEELGKEEAKRKAEETFQKRRAADPYVAAGVLAVTYLLAVYVWNAYGKPVPGYKERYYKELPANYPPAELAILYRRVVDSRDFTATLMDLARRGFMSVEEIPGEEGNYRFTLKSIQSEELQRLRKYESSILTLFEDIGGKEVTLEDFKQYAKDNKKTFAQFWKDWGKDVQDAANEQRFFDEDAKKALWFLVPAVAVFIAFPFSASLDMYITGVVCFIMAIVLIIVASVAASRRSDHGHEQYTKWKAFYRYLKEFSRVDTARVGSLGIWEEFLPYAITLGVADSMLKQLEVRFPNLEQDGYQYGSHWFLYHRPIGVARISQMTDTVGKTVSNLTTTHSTGSGGGFSGGGGGGFGGGGGGVR
ncbi:MAG: DUF2207 domain-containing protein [Firmicutes bacterium]|nr:DUF2207 domain-containing protein [Bacillota bacterium]